MEEKKEGYVRQDDGKAATGLRVNAFMGALAAEELPYYINHIYLLSLVIFLLHMIYSSPRISAMKISSLIEAQRI